MCCLMAMMLMLLTTRVLARHISSNLTSTLHILYGHHSRTWCNSSVPDFCISTDLMLQPYTDMSVINYYYDVFGSTSMTALHGVQCSVNHTCPGNSLELGEGQVKNIEFACHVKHRESSLFLHKYPFMCAFLLHNVVLARYMLLSCVSMLVLHASIPLKC